MTAPQPLAFNSPEDLLRKLKPRQDGVVLQIGEHSATYLPQSGATAGPDRVSQPAG